MERSKGASNRRLGALVAALPLLGFACAINPQPEPPIQANPNVSSPDAGGGGGGGESSDAGYKDGSQGYVDDGMAGSGGCAQCANGGCDNDSSCPCDSADAASDVQDAGDGDVDCDAEADAAID